MQLRLQRSQRTGGVFGKTVYFCLDVRGDYSPDEQDNIRRYKLGGQFIYNSQTARKHMDNAGAQLDRTQAGSVRERSAGLARGALSIAMAKMSLNISIASLGRGHHIECKDLEELLEAEDAVRSQCKSVTRYLDVAATFNGSEVVIDYVNGEEKVHIAQSSMPLLEYAPSTPEELGPSTGSLTTPADELRKEFEQLRDLCRERWLGVERKIIAFGRTKGWSLSELQVRVGSAVAGLLTLILVVKIL